MRRRENFTAAEFKAKAMEMAHRSAEATKRGAVAVGRGAKSLAKRAAPHVKRGAVAVGRAAKKGAKFTAKQTGRGMAWTGEKMAAWGTKANPFIPSFKAPCWERLRNYFGSGLTAFRLTLSPDLIYMIEPTSYGAWIARAGDQWNEGDALDPQGVEIYSGTYEYSSEEDALDAVRKNARMRAKQVADEAATEIAKVKKTNPPTRKCAKTDRGTISAIQLALAMENLPMPSLNGKKANPTDKQHLFLLKRAGTHVVFEPTPAGAMLYSGGPMVGEHGMTKPRYMHGAGQTVWFKGPRGGNVNVRWDQSGLLAVNIRDLTITGQDVLVVHTGEIRTSPVHRQKSNPGPPSHVRSRPHKDFMGQGTLYLVSTSRGNVYFIRYEGLRPVSEGGPRDRGVIGRFMSMSPSGDFANQDVPTRIVTEIEDVLTSHGVDLRTQPI